MLPLKRFESPRAAMPSGDGRIEKPQPQARRRRAAAASPAAPPPPPSSSPTRHENLALAVARMAREDAERSHLAEHADTLKSANEGERRRLRRAAREHGRVAYVRALERTVATNECEKSTLQALLDATREERNRLSDKLSAARHA